MRATSGLLGVVLLTSACTHWSSYEVAQPRREIGRRLLGAPAVATSKSASLAGGFSGSVSGRSAMGGLGGSTESISITHCVQQAEITFEQPYEVHTESAGRGWDVTGAILMGLVGASALSSAAHSEYDKTGTAIFGGVMVAGGVGLLAYSFGALPKGERPAVETKRRVYQENALVEATGCGLPGDPGAAPRTEPVPAAGSDAAARLKKLDELKAQGVINDAEYQKKRKEILDAL